MTLVALIPLLMAAVTGVGLTYFVLKRKSLAQSLCVSQAARTQRELKVPLEKLLRLNPRAATLRAKRLQAELRLQQALSTGNPAVIAAARTALQVVILEQSAFHGRQLALLAEAVRIRTRAGRELRSRTAKIPALRILSMHSAPNGLAVKAQPAGSPSPDYYPVANFASAQQHRFRFAINVLNRFPFLNKFAGNGNQQTECSVTLSQEKGKWGIQILMAKAP